jgi:hypothetical protein
LNLLTRGRTVTPSTRAMYSAKLTLLAWKNVGLRMQGDRNEMFLWIEPK